MYIRELVTECDITGERFAEPVMGYHIFARGATGRVCYVLSAGPNAGLDDSKASILEEVESWAEAVPGGYLDY